MREPQPDGPAMSSSKASEADTDSKINTAAPVLAREDVPLLTCSAANTAVANTQGGSSTHPINNASSRGLTSYTRLFRIAYTVNSALFDKCSFSSTRAR